MLLLDDLTSATHDLQVQSIAHGVVRLEQMYPEYGAERRRLIVLKYRGVRFRGGYHDYIIRRGGIEVFPRLVAGEHRPDHRRGKARQRHRRAGHAARRRHRARDQHADRRRGGDRQVVARRAVRRGGGGAGRERGALHLRREHQHAADAQCAGSGSTCGSTWTPGAVTVQQVDPAELSPGEFAHAIRRAVEQRGASIVVIDSLNGYLNAMPEERFLIIQLHELLTYLGQAGVATILIGAHHGLIGSQMITPVDASYLADAVILMRYFEARGEVRQAISVVKKRGGAHERTIREFRLESGRITRRGAACGTSAACSPACRSSKRRARPWRRKTS